MLTGLRLPFHFDISALRADLSQVQPGDWAPHYNDRDFGGVWRGAALRSRSGAVGDLNAGAHGLAPFRDTPLLDRCPCFREVLAAFPCPLKSVRLLALAPGSFIREHSDDALDFEDGQVRIHIPLQTNPGVEFYVHGERLLLEEGSAYYVNVNLPHRVNNRGAAERIHLVIDADVDDWLRGLFARSPGIPRIAPPARGVDAFRAAALTVPALRDSLRAIGNRAEFTAAAVRLGRETGFEFHEGDVDAVLEGSPRPGPPGGLPCAVEIRDGRPYVTWIDIGERPLSEPFFEETLRACMRNPYLRFSRREAPLDPPAATPAPPAGFIFHMSRCGSTLVARLFAAAGYRVISEAPPIDAIVQTGDGAGLRSIVEALGAGVPYVVKLDSWHIHNLPLIRETFPSTPWIFVCRDPAEVLASHRRFPGRQSLPGGLDPRALAMAADDITRVPRREWFARVLAAICRSAARHRAGGLFVDYRELPAAVWTSVAPHFGLSLTRDQIARMRECAQFDAKSPTIRFVPGTPDQQAEGQESNDLSAELGLDRLYAELHALSGARTHPPSRW